jgi:hypothetical protein
VNRSGQANGGSQVLATRARHPSISYRRYFGLINLLGVALKHHRE